MSEPSAMKRNLTPFNIVIAVLLVAGTIFMIMQPGEQSRAVGSDDALFTLSGKAYRAADLPVRFSQPLYQSELEAYNNRKLIAQAAAIDLYITQEAEKTQETPQQVAQRLFEVAQPSDEQLRSFYDANKGAINATFEQAKPQIGNYLMQMAQQAQQQALVQKLINLKELQLTMEAPVSPLVEIDTSGYPSKGPADAKVTLVEFADYQCPHCKEAHDSLAPVLEPYLNRVRFVYMDFPINRSGISRKVAEGAVCADQQDQFWAYQDRAFAQQASLSDASSRQIAEELGLDLSAFDSCVAAEATAAKVKAAEQRAIKAGSTGTPTFFINGQKVPLHDVAKELPGLLEQALNTVQ